MENGECGEPRGIVKNAQHILVMMSAKQRLFGRIFSMHSPLIRMALITTATTRSQDRQNNQSLPKKSEHVLYVVRFSCRLAKIDFHF